MDVVRWIGTLSLVIGVVVASMANAEPLAKDLFGSQTLPAAADPRVHGSYAKGCFAGGVAIAADGQHWQVMRLSRNRRWGHPNMVRLLERLSREATADGWPGLLIGDISQPRGGPMLWGHASHQLGLDADVWFQPMPTPRLTAAERETFEFVSLLREGQLTVDERKWTPAHVGILRRAAEYREVERILVHPGIKRKLCDTGGGHRPWLGKIRPIWGHDSHFHIRIACPAGSPDCRPQEPVASGDGCDSSLDWWFTDEPWRPASGPQQPRARDVMRLSDLPPACTDVLRASAPRSEAAATIEGPERLNTRTEAPPLAVGTYARTPGSRIPLPMPRPQP